MSWVAIVGATWLLLAVLIALLIGRAIHLADVKSDRGPESAAREPNFVVELPPVRALRPVKDAAGQSSPPASRPRSEPSTVPGIPVARPKLVGPSTPPSGRKSYRKSGLA